MTKQETSYHVIYTLRIHCPGLDSRLSSLTRTMLTILRKIGTMCTWGMRLFILCTRVITWPRQTIWLIGQSGSPEITTTQTSTCIRMERRVPDSTSLHSSITEEDLEDARQRLLLHQEENGTEYTTPLPPHQPVRNQTQYGSVSTIQSSQTTRPPATSKSYRLPFLILLVFDFGLIVFLSIICSVVGNT